MASIELNQEQKLNEEYQEGTIRPTETERRFKTQIDLIPEEEMNSPLPWGENFKGGTDAINTLGRPPKLRALEKKTNRQIREEELLALTRKFKPYVTKAVQAAVKVIDNPESADTNKLKASALLIQTYRQLLLDTFDHRYDSEEGEEVNDTTPVFSLKVLGESTDSGSDNE